MKQHLDTVTEYNVGRWIDRDVFDAAKYEQDPNYYIGRDQVEELLHQFLAPDELADPDTGEQVSCFGLVGTTGIGKTNLLCRLLEGLRSESRCATVLINPRWLQGKSITEY